MKYMLMMHTPRDGYTQYLSWPKAVLNANIEFMRAFSQRLRATGELIGAEGLASPHEARLVRADKDGRPITDGVFAESKEYLAGYWMVDVASPARAFEIAAEASTAPGAQVMSADGSPIEHFWIEVRGLIGSHGDLG